MWVCAGPRGTSAPPSPVTPGKHHTSRGLSCPNHTLRKRRAGVAGVCRIETHGILGVPGMSHLAEAPVICPS